MDYRETKKPNMDRDYVKTVSVCLNPQDNGGESVTLEVDFFHNGDAQNAVYTNVHINTGCYGVHGSKTSFYGVALEAFQKAFTHMDEVAYLVEKDGSKKEPPVSPRAGLESTPERKLAKIKDMIEGAEDYDVLQDIAEVVGVNVR